MNGRHRWALRGWIVVAGLLCGPAPLAARGLEVGEPGPMVRELRLAAVASASAADAPTTCPLVLVFVKQDDSHSARAIEQLIAQDERNAELFHLARVVVIQSRIDGNAEPLDRTALPPHWAFLPDTNDNFYAAYRIIATPTIVVLGAGGDVVGFHAGYNPGLIRGVQLDLLQEMRGMDIYRTFAPVITMELQMARRMAARGVWDRALPYFRAAAEQGPLATADALLMVEALVETKHLDEAGRMLESIESPDAIALRERIANEVQTPDTTGQTTP